MGAAGGTFRSQCHFHRPTGQTLDQRSSLLYPSQIRGKPAASVSRKRAQPNLVTCLAPRDSLPRPGWLEQDLKNLLQGELDLPFRSKPTSRREGYICGKPTYRSCGSLPGCRPYAQNRRVPRPRIGRVWSKCRVWRTPCDYSTLGDEAGDVSLKPISGS